MDLHYFVASSPLTLYKTLYPLKNLMQRFISVTKPYKNLIQTLDGKLTEKSCAYHMCLFSEDGMVFIGLGVKSNIIHKTLIHEKGDPGSV